MDVIFRSIGSNMLDPFALYAVLESLQACDASEATLIAASQYLETAYPEPSQASRAGSRAQTPMIVRYPDPNSPFVNPVPSISEVLVSLRDISSHPASSPKSLRLVSEPEETLRLKAR